MSRRDPELTIRKLNTQVSNFNIETIDIWLPNTMESIKEYFGEFGQPTLSMMGIIVAMNGARFYGNSPEEINNIGHKALGQVKIWISVLEESRRLNQLENQNISSDTNKLQSKKTVEGIHLPIKAELFYTIFAAIVAATFAIGLYFGGTKFDKEKIDFYNQVIKLSADTTLLSKSIQQLKEEINNYKSSDKQVVNDDILRTRKKIIK